MKPKKKQAVTLNSSKFTISQAEMVRNVLQTRLEFIKSLTDPRRDLDAECGYPAEVSITHTRSAYERDDIAARVVRIFPQETWASDPEIFEVEKEEQTPFEKEWERLNKKHNILSILQRADELSGVGRFGIILMGLDDGKALNEAVDGMPESLDEKELQPVVEHKLIYLRPFDESVVTVSKFEDNPQNPRYGLPLEYSIQFTDASPSNVVGVGAGTGATATTMSESKVHWHRVIHIADNRTNSEVYGEPRMKVVFNRLLDLQKIMGGAAEMFWKGGFPGLSIEQMDNSELVQLDTEATAEELEKYMNGLQRHLALMGVTVKSLAPQVADPKSHLECEVRLIAMALGVPWRILMGVEVGQLASEQDIRVWNRRLQRRREQYVNPYIIRPFVERLIAFGALPPVGEEGVQIWWADLNSPSDEDKATVAEKRTNALSKYVAGGCDKVMTPMFFLTLILGLSDEEAEAVLDEATFESQLVDPEPELVVAPPRGRANPALARNGDK